MRTGLTTLVRIPGLILLTAVSHGMACGNQVSNQCDSIPLAVERMLLPGQQTTLGLGLKVRCSSSPVPVVENVFVEVFSPSNKQVPFTVSFPIVAEPSTGVDAGTDLVVDVTFTPTQPGSWHLGARFEPNFGTAQQDINVVEWRGDASVETVSLNGVVDCSHFLGTDKGALLCLRSRKQATEAIVVNRANQQIEFESLTAEHDVVWRAFGGRLERLVDDGASLQISNSGQLTVGQQSNLRIVGNEVWVYTIRNAVGELTRAIPVPADGGLELERFATLFDVTGSALALMVKPAGILLADSFDLTQLSPDGGRHKIGGEATLAGSDSDAIWFWTTRGLEAVSPRADSFHRFRSAIPLPSSYLDPGDPFRSFSPVIPLSRGPNEARGVARLDPNGIVVEMFDSGVSYEPISSASRRSAYARSLDGKSVRIFSR